MSLSNVSGTQVSARTVAVAVDNAIMDPESVVADEITTGVCIPRTKEISTKLAPIRRY